MKQCRDCGEIKPLTEFHKAKECRLGVRPECRVCVQAWKQKHYEANKTAILAATTLWASANKDKRQAITQRYYYKNREKEQQRSNDYARRNPNVKRAQCARRRAAQLRATPQALLTEVLRQIDTIYHRCPAGHEVDHIVPLRGKTVSGLHVPWNLQYLPKIENRKKSNKYNPA